MRYYQNLTIIGTSHISKESAEKVEKEIVDNKPEVVAIELDKNRFYALMTGNKGNIGLLDIKKIGFKGYLFAKFGHWVEHKLGETVGTSPGDEMIKAAKAAEKIKAKIALIDQPIEITLKKFSSRISWKERFRFVWDLLTGWFRKDMKIKIDLSKAPNEEIIEKMILIVKKRYPNVYDVLIRERNVIMAKHLNKLMQSHNSIIAVVGAGHEKEVIKEIQSLQTSKL